MVTGAIADQSTGGGGERRRIVIGRVEFGDLGLSLCRRWARRARHESFHRKRWNDRLDSAGDSGREIWRGGVEIPAPGRPHPARRACGGVARSAYQPPQSLGRRGTILENGMHV